eukprot:1843587-Rhodomonas_salina.1
MSRDRGSRLLSHIIMHQGSVPLGPAPLLPMQCLTLTCGMQCLRKTCFPTSRNSWEGTRGSRQKTRWFSSWLCWDASGCDSVHWQTRAQSRSLVEERDSNRAENAMQRRKRTKKPHAECNPQKRRNRGR